jgi:DNA-binding transcriptional regulator YiaG
MRETLGVAEIPDAQHASAVGHADMPNPPHPLRLALYFVERDMPIRHKIRMAKWMDRDKDALMKSLTPLQREGIVADTFLLADSTIHGYDIQKIRQAAARYDADAVLIVEGVGAVDRHNNGYAAWYVTLIGAYFAPGTVSDALVMIHSSLWNARSERLYTTQTAEGRSTLTGSAVSLEDGQALAQAKTAALVELGKRTVDEWRQSRTLPARDRSR